MHELHEKRPALRPLIEASIGPADSFHAVSHRTELMETARRMGLPIPETRMIGSEEDIHRWFDDFSGGAVLKVDGTWGGSGVAMAESAEQATSAWRRFCTPEPRASAWKRWLINRDPLAFWSRQQATARGVSLQRYVPGRPANAMATCWRGEVLGMASVEVLCSQGPTGASTVVRLIHNPQIAEAVTVLARGLGLSGFCGLDFILEEGTGTAFLVELNGRCTQLGHLVLPGRGDLAGLLCAQLGAPGRPRTEMPIDRDVIAFFPQALAWHPDNPYMQQCYHDVPWGEPALVRELLRQPWAERQWLSRLYHRMTGRKPDPLPSAGHFQRLAARLGFSSDPGGIIFG
ncbi:MAG TPA: hypothetical protein VFX20_14775 [Steroidobacteraceae bacterium]|nr:hypothetical protein [Steroidobacteraceae bacterium]